MAPNDLQQAFGDPTMDILARAHEQRTARVAQLKNRSLHSSTSPAAGVS